MLELRKVTKHFAGQPAVRGVSFSVGAGEFFSLLGPSGCGKTTLLRLLAGFETPDAGEILLDGDRLDKAPPHQRACNMIFQRYALFPHLSVRGNVGFGLSLNKTPKAERLRRVDEALALVELTGFENRRVTSLSGGEQQRVAIARALVMRPRFLLLDEPLAALDLKLRQKMQVELLRLQRRLGLTFVYVTHAQDEALTLSDRMAVMNRGFIEQIGTPSQVYQRPASAFVAGFIGTCNTFAGTVVRRDAQSLFIASAALGELALAADRPGYDSFSAGTAVSILLRPEHLRVIDGERPLTMRLRETLYRGSSYELLGDNEHSAQSLSVHVAPHDVSARLTPGTRLSLEFDPAQAHVLRVAP